MSFTALRQKPIGSDLTEYIEWLRTLKTSAPWWSFTFFTGDNYMYRERWERDNPIMKQELADIAHNFSPLYGYRHLTKKAVNYASKNSWYQYQRHIEHKKDGSYSHWRVEVFPTAENPDKPLEQPHHIFKVVMPEEFLNDKIFYKNNLKTKDWQEDD